MASHRNVVRKEQARQELDRLRDDVCRWLECRRHADQTSQYETQLNAIADVLERGRTAAASELEAIDDDAPAGAVYARCRETEERAVFLRRYWEYFASKWAQRDDPLIGPAVRAADEVVWSCWAPLFSAVGNADPAPAPLPYIEPFYTPRAFPRTDPPLDLQVDHPLLRDALKILPIPTVGLPPVCVARPWWLIFVAHETAHHLHRDVLAGQLYKSFHAVLGAVEVTGPAKWADWHEELFADAVSVLLTGTAASWAMSELLLAPNEALIADTARYPSPVVRDAFMTSVVAAAGLPPDRGLPARPAVNQAEQTDAYTASLLGDVASVARAAALGPLDGELTLMKLCQFDAAAVRRGGEVAKWRDAFVDASKPDPRTTAEAARRALAGAVAAWEQIAGDEAEASREARAKQLGQTLVELLPECRPEGRRALSAPIDTTEAQDSLLAALLAGRPLVDVP